LPSLVFEVTSASGKPLTDVRISIDGMPAVEVRATAMAVDPTHERTSNTEDVAQLAARRRRHVRHGDSSLPDGAHEQLGIDPVRLLRWWRIPICFVRVVSTRTT
jgi:hypothetical protein